MTIDYRTDKYIQNRSISDFSVSLNNESKRTTRWSDLDFDLLLMIFEKLLDLPDIYRCGTVCVSWQSVAKTILPPFLLLSKVSLHAEESDFFFGDFHSKSINSFYCDFFVGDFDSKSINSFYYEKSCTLFNIRTHKIHEVPLPEEEKGNIWYSSSGFWWLITIGVEPPHEIGLFNPFTRDRITLPRASDLLKVREELRVITSANPLIDPKFSVLATHSCGFKIAFCRPGDSSWTSIKGFQGICNDTIFHKGEFFAVNHRGDLFRINCGNFTAEKLALRPIEFPWHWYCNYLVELDGDLLLVARWLEETQITCSKTTSFTVYKLNWVEKGWIKIKNIGDNSILLGKNSSISLPRNHFINFEANCIYFIDDADGFNMTTKYLNMDTGLYNIVTRQFKWPSPNYNKETEQLEKLPSSIWGGPLNWFIP
ncbi:hypothetical protein Ddye_027536 [Dipteronia dyeriana]|uniref:F-box domain-containing protein n=1 Tax=Dipteronia dyeriana TaxID=168575 RepID=A0AAD9TPY6_9ROSI|nr:hypothetical protein Ddye_027536 [Dipteronia dyeriana]